MQISGQTAEEYFEYECKDEKAKHFYNELMADKTYGTAYKHCEDAVRAAKEN